MTREEEAKNLLTKMGYKIIKESLEDVEDEELKAAVEELAENTGNDIEDVEVEDSNWIDGYTVKFGNEEYIVFDNYDSVEEAAKDSVLSLIDDCGGVLKSGIRFENLGGIEKYLDEDDALSIIEETERNMLEELDEEELEEQYGTTDIDEALEVLIKDSVAGDPIGYIQDQWGKEELQVLIDNGAINFNEKELAEDVVNADGLANSLASYDGEEIELGNGYYAYRIN